MAEGRKMIIRKASKKDIPGIMDLLKQVCLVHHLGRPDLFQYGKQKYTAPELENLLLQPDRPVFVAVDETANERVLGHAFCIHQQEKNHNVLTDVKTLYIDDICVHSECRKKGVGKQLYHYVYEYAKQENYYNITLNVWSFNESALRFYEDCGMTVQKMGMETILP